MFNNNYENIDFNPKEISEIFLSMTSLLFNQIPIPINLVDSDCKIINMNKAFLEFLKLKECDVIGKPLTDIDPTVRLPIVVKTGKAEIGKPHKFQDGRSAIVHRIPLFYKDTIIGGVGAILFDDLEYLYNLVTDHDIMKTSITKEQKKTGDIYKSKYDFDDILTKSFEGKKCKELAQKYSHTNFSVLITGESGVGKELFAHAIHKNSSRKNGPFVRINCGAIPDALLESELFGYDEGAFTGAHKSGRKGKFELANGGTIFLDEIGDLPLTMQVKLLRVLQEREIEKIGGNKIIKLDIRVIAATNTNLEEKVQSGMFRSDLFYRLNVLNLNVPPLRNRADDVPLLIQHFITSIYQEFEIFKIFPTDIIEILKTYHWPGNIRELKNVVDRIIVNTVDDVVLKESIPNNILEHHSLYMSNNLCDYNDSVIHSGSLKQTLIEIENKIIKETLKECKGNKAATARKLGMPRMTLYRKLNDL